MDIYEQAQMEAKIQTKDVFDDVLKDDPTQATFEESQKASIFTLGFDERKFAKRIQTVYKIEEKTSGAMLLWGPLLKRNTIQLRLLRRIIEELRRGGPIRLLILKGRKPGVSTMIECLALELACQIHNYKIGVIAQTQAASQTLFKITRKAYDNMPPDQRPQMRTSRLDGFEFGIPKKGDRDAGKQGQESGFEIATAKGDYPFTGSTIRFLHLSECGKYDAVGDMDAQMKFIMSALGAMPSIGHSVVIAETTSNGQQGWFYETWTRAVSATPTKDGVMWVPIFLSWLDDPSTRMQVPADYDWDDWWEEDAERERQLLEKHNATRENLMFRRFQINNNFNMDFDRFSQEFPTTADEAFLSSGRPAIPKRFLDAQQANFLPPAKVFDASITLDEPLQTYEVVNDASRQAL